MVDLTDIRSGKPVAQKDHYELYTVNDIYDAVGRGDKIYIQSGLNWDYAPLTTKLLGPLPGLFLLPVKGIRKVKPPDEIIGEASIEALDKAGYKVVKK